MSDGVNHGLKRDHGGGSGGSLHFATMSRDELAGYTRLQSKCCEGCCAMFFREVGSGAVECARCIASAARRQARELVERERFRPVSDPKKMMPQ